MKKQVGEPAVGPAVRDTAGSPDRGPTLALVVAPRRVLVVGLSVIAVLTLLNLVTRLVAGETEPENLSGILFHLVPLTNLDAEGNLPAWFSSMLLLLCALSLWTLAHDTRARGDRWSRYWQLLALGFLYLSVDESALLHERAGQRVRAALDLDGALYFSWVVVAVPAIIVMALVLLRFQRSLPRWTNTAFVVAAGLYVGGAVGLEMVGASLVDSTGYGTVPYILVSTVEEVLEMVGVTLFLAALGEHRRRYVEPGLTRS